MSERIVILNFHGIGEPHAGVDSSERPYWVGTDRWDAILRLVDAHPNGRRVEFTFDDGNRSDLDIAAPALAQRGRKGAFYILAGRFDDPHYLSRADCRALAQMGMEVGLHGRSHVDWRRLHNSELADEVDAARGEIAAAAGAAVTSVGIPFGAYDRRVMRYLRARGFAHIRTSDGGGASRWQQVQNRTSMRNDMSIAQVADLLDARESVAKRLRRAASTMVRRHVR